MEEGMWEASWERERERNSPVINGTGGENKEQRGGVNII